MNNITLPTITHAKTSFNQWNRVVIQMDDGWMFYDRAHYGVDENGDYIVPSVDELIYSYYGVYAPDTDFDNRIVVVAKSEV